MRLITLLEQFLTRKTRAWKKRLRTGPTGLLQKRMHPCTEAWVFPRCAVVACSAFFHSWHSDSSVMMICFSSKTMIHEHFPIAHSHNWFMLTEPPNKKAEASCSHYLLCKVPVDLIEAVLHFASDFLRGPAKVLCEEPKLTPCNKRGNLGIKNDQNV